MSISCLAENWRKFSTRNSQNEQNNFYDSPEHTPDNANS